MTATVERRRLIGGAAWTLPVIALAAPAPAMAASCPPLDVVLDWSSGYVRTSDTFGSWTLDPDGTGPVLPVTVTVSSTFVGQMAPTTATGLTNLGITAEAVGGYALPGLGDC